MKGLKWLQTALAGGASMLALAHPGAAKEFDVPRGDLASALDSYMVQAGVQIVFSDDAVRGHHSPGARGDYTELAALEQILRGTGFTTRAMQASAIGIVPDAKPVEVAQADRRPAAPPPASSVETVVVTAQKRKEDIQQVPIAVTALTQQQLTERQVAGGPDLVKEVPNLTFSKTNFTGYNLEIRGIGTQAISVTTDPAVAVAFNDVPFIRNHFFEQEFYDLQDVEVLRGPQGTLYGRNATAGVVNLKSAQPTDQFEAMGSADFGNYSNRRLEGMVNLPIVGDKLDLRLAGEWTKRDGYSFNTVTDQPVDGRDLWSTRASLRWRPNAEIDANLIWEHFSEDDNRMRTAKQLCKTAPEPPGVDTTPQNFYDPALYLSQGCEMTSLYSAAAFQVPNGFTLPYYSGIAEIMQPVIRQGFDPYASTTQSTNLRDIETQINPIYRAKNDTLELNVDYAVTPALTLTSQTGYNHDYLWSTEDYNRFDTRPGIFASGNEPFAAVQAVKPDPLAGTNGIPADAGVFCDPQLGCSDRLLAQDLSEEHAWQASQEFRLASNFGGPLNFSAGANYLHYETVEDYYVFINTLSLLGMHNNEYTTYVPGVTDNHECLQGGYRYPSFLVTGNVLGPCYYIDPNPIGSLNGEGHNYFLSQNPYVLNSYAMFGEVYYNLTNDLKWTGGLRWTEDQKHFLDIPSEVIIAGWGYPVSGVVNQQYHELTGRSVLSWTPKLDFTDSTLFYASYAHGYKAGGANPPGALFPSEPLASNTTINPLHPLTFKPEHIEAFELGTKNALLDGSLTLNGDVFYYNYHDYQISRIVDRSAINDNFNAHVLGTELESTWEPLPGLRFNLAAGWEDAQVGNGMESVDLMDRTAGVPGWEVVRPFLTEASNCILPTYVLANIPTSGANGLGVATACDTAYNAHLDPVTGLPYVPNPTVNYGGGSPPAGYPGFDPLTAPNNGQGFDKNLSGNRMPNAPPMTLSFGAQYSIPVSDSWAATLREDFYYQANSWARVFNDNPYDRLHAYTNLNLALILTSGDGWQVMGYVKNVFNTTAITGDFLNSDDTGLTTNVFLTDPRLYGVRVTKNFGEGDSGAMKEVEDYISGLFADTDNGRPPLWIELGGGLAQLDNPQGAFSPPWLSSMTIPAQEKALHVQSPLGMALEQDATLSFQPADSDWVVAASVRYGRSSASRHEHQQTANKIVPGHVYVGAPFNEYLPQKYYYPNSHVKFADGQSRQSERHLLIDFKAGKDVGLGLFGPDGTSVISAGVRIAQLQSRSSVTLHAEPDVHYPSASLHTIGELEAFVQYHPHFHDYGLYASTTRSFHGAGPSVSWDASAPLFGNSEGGELGVDWGLNGAVLFGRQHASGHHKTTTRYYYRTSWNRQFQQGKLIPGRFENNNDPSSLRTCFGEQLATAIGPQSCKTHAPPGFDRSREATVPELGFSAGVSYRYQNAKISFGYRADVLFGAMDGGIDSYKSETRGFFGPYAKISIGLGG